jgi:uncharacterized delta-60 repeat protein
MPENESTGPIHSSSTFRYLHRTRHLFHMTILRSLSTIVACGIICTFAWGQAGSLDPTFNGTGIVTVALPDHSMSGGSAGLQSTGNIILAGGAAIGLDSKVVLYRRLPDGTADPSFGDAGVAILPSPGLHSRQRMAVLPDDRIVVSGLTNAGPWMACFTADGELDTSFGNGGTVNTTLWGPASGNLEDMAITSDGSILLAGHVTGTTDGNDLFVLRYSSQGVLDSSFRDGSLFSLTEHNDIFRGMAVRSDGRIFLVGSLATDAPAPIPGDLAVVALLANGELDPTFGDGGISLFHVEDHYVGGYTIGIRTDGSLVVGGFMSTNGYILQFAMHVFADGTLDTDFGNDGISSTMITVPELYPVMEMAMLADGGAVQVSADCCNAGGYDISLYRYAANGWYDPEFEAPILIHLGGSEASRSVALQADGKILVGGEKQGTAGTGLLLLRFLNDEEVGVPEIVQGRSRLMAYPNPVLECGQVEFALSDAAFCTIQLRDVQGRTVRTLSSRGFRPPGTHTVQFELKDVLAGYYQLCLESDAGIMASTPLVKL